MAKAKAKAKVKAKSNGSAARIVGREGEFSQISRLVGMGRNVLIEGPVGVGKTFLVKHALETLGLGYERVDGDSRYTEAKLTGWFDPPQVLKKGYSAACFIDGPLLVAMRRGRILFINELNRMPEAVQNILLPAMDERVVTIPKLGVVRAKEGFAVVATQNPREFTATHAVSEALLDRFEMVQLDYQSRDEEIRILGREAVGVDAELTASAVDVVRGTRGHPGIKRGASVRAAIAIARLCASGLGLEESALLALPSRIELVSTDEDARAIIRDLVRGVPLPLAQQKKNS